MSKEIVCKRCGRKPGEINEYIQGAKDFGIGPEEYIITEEGTYNENTGKFYCTKCYIEIGMPLGKA